MECLTPLAGTSDPASATDPPGRDDRGVHAASAAWIEAARGELRRAELLAASVLDDGRASDEALAGALLATGVVAWDRDLLPDARIALDAGLDAAERAADPTLGTLIRIARAMVASSAGANVEAIGRVVDLGHPREPLLRTLIDEVDVVVHLAAGDVDRAEVLVHRLPDGPSRQLLWARIALARGRAGQVLDAMPPVLADDDLPRRQQIEAHILVSRAEEAHGDHEAARRAHEAASVLSRPQGSVRAYLDHGVQPPGTPVDRRGTGGTRLDLSVREQQVLRLLVRRLDNREIGEAMFVSVNTVKTHLQSIYRKLGVASRREAVARAVERGLL